MKPFLFFALTVLFLSGAENVSDAQNPVKKVKYLTHPYEGEVGEKKVPEGKGTMQFDGFEVRGTFQGSEVSDAIVASKSYRVFLAGDICYNKSQEVVLKSGGRLYTVVYKFEDNRYNQISTKQILSGDYRRNEYDLVGIPVLVRKLEKDESFIADSFNLREVQLYNKYETKLPKELDAPSSVQKCYTLKDKITIQYSNEEATDDGKTRISKSNWDQWRDGSYYQSTNYSYKKSVFFITSSFLSENKEFLRIEDDENRVWSWKNLIEWAVYYPDGDYLKNDEARYSFKYTLLDNYTIEQDLKGPRDMTIFFKNIVEKDHKSVEAILEKRGTLSYAEAVSLFAGKSHNPGTLPSEWNNSIDGYETIIRLRNCEGFTNEQIHDLIENELFKPLGNALNRSNYYTTFTVYMNDDKEHIGQYDSQKKEYLSEEERQERLERERQEQQERLEKEKQERLIEIQKHNEPILSKLESFKKRFGFDPSKSSMRDLVKVGRSFKLLNEYFEFRYKLYYAYNKPASWKYKYPNESFSDYTVYDEDRQKKDVVGDGYYFTLSIDNGASKCYDFGDTFNGKRGYIWVNGDKISSVTWY